MSARALAALAGLCAAAAMTTPAQADVFNGRIAFTSFRASTATPPTGDVFTMNADGSGLRQLTENPADDAQSDWAPDGRDIAYRIRKPDSRTGFEVARMPGSGEDHLRLTVTPTGEASSQPSWFPDASRILFRRSRGDSVGSIWRMDPFGADPLLWHDPPGPQLYPSLSPDIRRIIFTTAISDTDRAIQVINADDGTGLVSLFDVPGAYDSAPGLVAGRHDARLLEWGRRPPSRHRRDDCGRHALGAADRVRRAGRVARLGGHPGSGHR